MACNRVASIGSKAYNVPSVNSRCPCCPVYFPVSNCHWVSKVHSLTFEGAFIGCRRCIHLLSKVHSLTFEGAFIGCRRCIHWVSKVHSLTFECAFIGCRRCIHWVSKVHSLTFEGALADYKPEVSEPIVHFSSFYNH